jgi:hypothetical protein
MYEDCKGERERGENDTEYNTEVRVRTDERMLPKIKKVSTGKSSSTIDR